MTNTVKDRSRKEGENSHQTHLVLLRSHAAAAEHTRGCPGTICTVHNQMMSSVVVLQQ